MGSHKWNQGIEVLGRTAFADKDFHPEADFLQSLGEGVAFMVGGDARAHIFLQVATCQSGGMTINGFSVTFGSGDFIEDFRVVEQHARVVHHLGKVMDVGRGHEFLHRFGVQYAACRLECGGRHTTRCPKEELERHLFPIVNHVFDTFCAQHIGDFVWVADGGHCAMTTRQSGKLRRNQHGAFDVHMRINKTWHNILRVTDGLFLNLGDFAVLYYDDTRKNP